MARLSDWMGAWPDWPPESATGTGSGKSVCPVGFYMTSHGMSEFGKLSDNINKADVVDSSAAAAAVTDCASC